MTVGRMELLLPRMYDVTVRSETLPALIGVTLRHESRAVTVVGAHQSVLGSDRGLGAALAEFGKDESADVGEVGVAFEASSARERVDEQRLADPRSRTMYVDESEV